MVGAEERRAEKDALEAFHGVYRDHALGDLNISADIRHQVVLTLDTELKILTLVPHDEFNRG